MAHWNAYHLPQTVEEALSLLSTYSGEARVVAGGTDLLLDLEEGSHPPVAALVDVSRIAEMQVIERQGAHVLLGAAATHSRIVGTSLLRHAATCLVESCGVIGGPQVRNVATIGGNVGHALPAADGTVSLVALDAEAQIARLTRDGKVARVWHPILDLFLGPGQLAVDSGREIITAFRFLAHRPGEGSAFDRIMRPQAVALPILGVAARVQLTPDRERYAQVAICIGPAGPVPFRPRAAEMALVGQPVGEKAVQVAVERAVQEARLRTSKYRATKAYRQEMVRVLLRRVLWRAVDRARVSGGGPAQVNQQYPESGG